MTTLVPLTAEGVIHASIGGVLIGLSAGLMLLGTGRVAGISGIFGSLLLGNAGSARLLFLLGLFAGPWIVWLSGLGERAQALAAPDWPKVIVAGLLVGVGTQLSNGCTSGHGVCGLANFSGRGLTATVTFMLVAGLVVLFGFGGLSQ